LKAGDVTILHDVCEYDSRLEAALKKSVKKTEGRLSLFYAERRSTVECTHYPPLRNEKVYLLLYIAPQSTSPYLMCAAQNIKKDNFAIHEED
jgi:hypothetical protein